MLFRAGVVAWRNTTQDLNWHLFWGDVLEGWCWNTCFEEVGIETDCAYNFRDLDKLLIYINIWKFRQNSIQIILFCPTQAQNQYKSGAANNDFNFDFQHFLIISSIFFLGKSCSHQIPYIPTNQSTNRDQQENPLPANPSRDSPWSTHRIHPSFPDEAGGPSARCSWDSKDGKRGDRRRSCRVVMGGWLFFVTLHSKLTWQRKIHLFQ